MSGSRLYRPSRRDVLRAALSTIAAQGCGRSRGSCAPASPEPAWGVQSGDVTATSAVVWSRSDRPARMFVEWSTSPTFDRATAVAGPQVDEATDHAGKVALVGLPSGRRIHYRARFDASPWLTGSFGTAPLDARDVTLAWSADTNGQGWGIDDARGGMPTYAAMLARAPDLFIHCGDEIYADNPIPGVLALTDGTICRNLVDPAKDHVAETLADFRGAHRYARRSREVRAFAAAVPSFAIWDDHEVHDNWFPGQTLPDARYTERRTDVLAVHGRRAMHEYAPTLRAIDAPMYRVVSWGPLLDVFLTDDRSHRSPNELTPERGGLFGDAQAAWLVEALASSRAVWKVIACAMPIGVVIAGRGADGKPATDGWAAQGGPPREREIELAGILSALKAKQVTNVVWITGDVHYSAAHRFDPAKAVFKDFDPFWELVAGPLHATTFPTMPTDDTFGAELAWSSGDARASGSPADGRQHFGLLRIDGKSLELTAMFVDARGRDLHRLVLPAQQRAG